MIGDYAVTFQGTAGKEAEAGLEMSLLVNYIQPVHFHSFEISESEWEQRLKSLKNPYFLIFI